jgi:hypothetical protein
MFCYVLTNADTINPVGHLGTKTLNMTPANMSYSASSVGSMGFVAWEDWQTQSGTLSANLTTDVALTFNSTGAIAHQTTNATGLTTQTFSVSGVTDSAAAAYVEMLPTGTGSPIPPLTPGPSTPQPTYTVKMNGVDVTQYVIQNSISITQNWGRQADTCVFNMNDDRTSTTPNFVVKPMQTVLITDTNLNRVLFGGVVSKPECRYYAPGVTEWTANCVSNAQYAASREVSYKYTDQTMGAILRDLTVNAGCGITANSVTTGPVIDVIQGQFEKLTDAWSKICQMASTSTVYGWWVDDNLDLHVVDRNTATSSGVTFTDVATAGGNHIAEAHYNLDSFKYTWDASQLGTRCYVLGGKTSLTNTDIFWSDGIRLRHALHFMLNTNPVAASLKVHGIVNTVSTGNTTQWQLTQDTTTQQWFLTPVNGVAPKAGYSIKLTYTYLADIAAVAQNSTAISTYNGPNSGFFDLLVSDTSLTTLAAARLRAKRELQEYCFAQEIVTLDSSEDWAGWVNVGETFIWRNSQTPDSQNTWLPGMNKTFLCVSVRTSVGAGGFRRTGITAMRAS